MVGSSLKISRATIFGPLTECSSKSRRLAPLLSRVVPVLHLVKRVGEGHSPVLQRISGEWGESRCSRLALSLLEK